MRCFGYLCAVLCLAGYAVASGPAEEWLPITPRDLQIKEVPGDPGASAIQLYYADYIHYNDRSEFFYHRIKVLTDSGREYANVEITLPPFRKIKLRDLQARTILPDGRIVPFTGEPFEKIIVKGHGRKIVAQVFTLPEVSIGSIIEYKYRVQSDAYPDPEWLVQHDLFTVKEHFLFSYPSSWPMTFDASPGVKAPTKNKNGFELEVHDVLPFVHEEQMPPEDKYRLRVRFFYGSVSMFMMGVGGPTFAGIENFVNPTSEIRTAVVQAIGNETDAEKQLRKLYDRAQQIRNLTYERARSESEQKKERLEEAKSAADVLKHGYGDHDEITLLFVAMSRAVGFDASILLVAGRSEHLFDDKLPALVQVDSEIALIQLSGRTLYLDPGTKFCPFGLLRWMRTATTAVLLKEHSMTYLATPPPIPDDFMITRTADVVLAEDGSLHGTVSVEYRRGEALERRMEALNTDVAGRARQLEDEVKAWVPDNAAIKLTKVEGWDSTDSPLIAYFDLQLPAYASVTGKRLLLPLFLFRTKHKYAFTAAERHYPVYFPYGFSELDTLYFTIPPGFTVESAPPALDVQAIFADYSRSCQLHGRQMTIQRRFTLDRMKFSVNEYPKLKDFFSEVKQGDELQAVLHPPTAATQAAH